MAGQPWPILDDGVGFTPVPSLDMYRESDPFRMPRPNELHSDIDLYELGIRLLAGFPEPRTFALRVRRLLRARRGELDLIHDNQSVSTGLLGILRDGWPLLETLHHPITVDRELALAHAGSAWQRFTTRRWYGFLRMQVKVARRLPRIVTVSESSKADIGSEMGVDTGRISVVPVGVDHTVFRPQPERPKVAGRVMVTSSSDQPMKGLVPLLEAIAKLRTERHVELVVVGRPHQGGRVDRAIERLGLASAVTCVSGISDEELAALYAESQVAVVPSLYEGFSLPAIEAMACGVPLVATTGGALPEVVGREGDTGMLVEPDDPEALASGIRRVLDEPDLARRLGEGGRRRVLGRFTWAATAQGTAEQYGILLEEHARSASTEHSVTAETVPEALGAGWDARRAEGNGRVPDPDCIAEPC
jgi:glycosyltransferase involved in cell wall biosynthesis